MRLELLIVTTIFLVFLGLNILGDNIQKDKQAILLEQNSTNQTSNYIEGGDYILKQMSNKSTKSEVTNLTNKNDLILQEELKEKNKVFIELTNATN